MPGTCAMNEAMELYRLLWTHGHGEIRSYSHGARSRWCVAEDEASMKNVLAWAASRSDLGENVAGGVNPRSRMRHPCGKAKDVPAYIAAVLDFDTDPEAGLRRLRALGLEPSVVVHSGRGMHAYLLLDRPEPADEFRPVAKALCDATGSDAVHDPGRILRTPGTVNPRTATMARILTWNPGLRWSAKALRERLPTALKGPERPSPPIMVHAARKAEGGSWTYLSRSEATMGAARRLWLDGLSEAEALSRLMAGPHAARSEDDVRRVVRKVWADWHPSTSRIEVNGIAHRASGTFLKVRVVSGAHAGSSWWQRIDGVESHVKACLGSSQVGAQGGAGEVGLSMMRLNDGSVVPRVRMWLPMEGRA